MWRMDNFVSWHVSMQPALQGLWNPKPESLFAEWNSLIECSELIIVKEVWTSFPMTTWQMEEEVTATVSKGWKSLSICVSNKKLEILRQHFSSFSQPIPWGTFLCVCVTKLIPRATTKLTHDDSLSFSSVWGTCNVRFKMTEPCPIAFCSLAVRNTTAKQENLPWSQFALARPLPFVTDRWSCCNADHYIHAWTYGVYRQECVKLTSSGTRRHSSTWTLAHPDKQLYFCHQNLYLFTKQMITHIIKTAFSLTGPKIWPIIK